MAFADRLDAEVASATYGGPTLRACYALPGYEPDPCLPPDDGFVTWLDMPGGCEPHVKDGPFPSSGRGGRQCCYTVTCVPLTASGVRDRVRP